ncbi:MAG: M23 family metallopeptidase [Sulfurimonas sp.]|nr:M23 family metallopeptidase [Sulfurimonas sp.]
MKYFILTLVLVCSLSGFGFNMSSSTIANGKTVFIEFDKNDNIEYKHVRIDKKRFKIYNNFVLIPISYYEKAKNLKLIVNYRENSSKMKFHIINLRIVDGKYKKEILRVAKGKVSLNKSNKIRAAKEYKEAMSIYNSFTEESYLKTKFIMPLNSKITSDFGNARMYNGSLSGYHSGTDFRAKVGTPLISSNDGVVVLVKDRFYSGGSVIIDHGRGIYIGYSHMSSFNVKKNQRVKKGQIIGLSGVSGRVTGPHLHFSARVSGVQVDPLQLIKLLNKRL